MFRPLAIVAVFYLTPVVLSTICLEGSCQQSPKAGSAKICSSGKWQEMEVDPWRCIGGSLALTNISDITAGIKQKAKSLQASSSYVSSAHPTATEDTFTAPEEKDNSNVAIPEQGALAAMIYYPNYAVYDRNFPPESITSPERFTHILYAFANIGPDGTVHLSDLWADLEKPSDLASGAIKGNIKRLQGLKQANPRLKILLSVGGWGYRDNFATPLSSPTGIESFARTATDLVSLHGFDGLDIDWEYPSSSLEGDNLCKTLRATRRRLDAMAQGREPLLLVAAVSPNKDHYQYLPIAAMNSLLDYWLLKGYDYAGSFSKTVAHASNIYASQNSDITPFNTHDGMTEYKKQVSPSKIVLGMPLYGHDFLNTDGLGHEYSGNSQGSWPDPSDQGPTGVWDCKVTISALG